MSEPWTGRDDARLLRLCAEFLRHAEARTVEGDRLDGLPWSNEVNAGYLELSRDAQDHGAMLAAILATAPGTLQGLVAKARVISRHQQDPDADPIGAAILADDVLRLLQDASSAAPDPAGSDAGTGAETREAPVPRGRPRGNARPD